MVTEENRQTTEVRESVTPTGDTVRRESVATSNSGAPASTIASRVIWYVAGVIIALLALRVVLQLLGANRDSGFVDFVYSLSGVFAAPFFGIFNYQPTYGASTFEVSSIVAIVVYALVAWGVAKLFTLTNTRADA